ncbi:hypothetical protein CFC21_077172 [Triticum aestivum]|uniref:DUF6598 domain-containing protein n=2 Tax=Triticum aestivum TaxID=4565 RepID=A0A3B6MRE1_WHEAT|nr:uncharacterized protein LOC123120825 [Triticum aestivum]KAF7071965.1 hypothetical protein CFC21_077172 [Triticum aestivum]
MAGSSINVISLRVVKSGPEHTYPVEVYGRVIARDEVDYKCVVLFDRERKDAQFINSEKDMLALTGPRRALVTDGLMCFEFDLKVKGKGGPDCDVQFSKGVILYRHNFYNKRMISQLPSFQSTVKLVLQHVASPMAASVEVSLVRKQQLGDRAVHFNGKITVGTARNYRQHMVVYDSSRLPSGDLVTETGSLVLDHNLLAVSRRIRDNTLKGDEQETIYVCFLGAGSEIEDEDYIRPEEEDEDEDDIVSDEEGQEEPDEMESAGAEDDGDDPTSLVALKYPLSETLCEHGSLKLKVKVHWTAIIEAPLHGEFLTRLGVLLEGYKLPDYRRGSANGSFCE